MRFADLVINCIKETLHNDDVNLNVTHLRDGTLEKQPDYATELNNVCISINKAISRLLTANKVETKHTIITANPENDVYDISSITDLRKIRSVFIMKNGKPYWIGWSVVGQGLLYLGYGISDTIHIAYERKIPNFTESNWQDEIDLESEYGLTDELCNYINYFVKSELWEETDPDRCKRYLNYFEQFVNEVDTRQNVPHQSEVRAKYKI